jgi:hypothetical protein
MTAATGSSGRRVAEAWLAAALAAVSLFFVVYLWTNPVGTPVFGVSANTLPLSMSILLLLLAVLLLGEALFALKLSSARTVEPAETTNIGGPAVLFIVCVVYIVALPWLGFLLSSAALIGVTAWLFGNRRPVTLIALMVLAPFALSIFFEKAMIIYLPAGKLFQ